MHFKMGTFVELCAPKTGRVLHSVSEISVKEWIRLSKIIFDILGDYPYNSVYLDKHWILLNDKIR
jgi:hypothetical protein